MGAAYLTLICGDLLGQICDFHTDDSEIYIKKSMGYRLMRRIDSETLRAMIHGDIGANVTNKNISLISLIICYGVKTHNIIRSNIAGKSLIDHCAGFQVCLLEFVQDIMEWALVYGDLQTLIWTHEQLGCMYTRSYPMDIAAKHGHLDIVRWLYEKRYNPYGKEISVSGHNLFDLLAREGQLHIMQWLDENITRDVEVDAREKQLAIQNGYLDKFTWLHKDRISGCSRDSTLWAAGNGHLHVLQWLCDHKNMVPENDVIYDAIFGGHFSVVEWLYVHKKVPLPINAILAAFNRGYIDLATWLYRRSSKLQIDFAYLHGDEFSTEWLSNLRHPKL